MLRLDLYLKLFISKIFNYFFYFLICVPILIFLIIISPILLIRFYCFNYRVGHFSEDLFLYLNKKKIEKNNSYDLFCIDESDGKVNLGLLLIAKHNGVKFFPKFFIKKIFFFIKILSFKWNFLKRFLAYERNSKKDGYQYFNKNFEFLIPEKINNLGNDFLKKINPEKKKIICINLWNSDHLMKKKNLDWSYHKFRNSSFQNYIKTINYLTEIGFLVIKVGKSNNESVIKNNPNFIDYSFKYQNDYLDIAILNNCYAYISNQTGLDYFCFALNKPMLINASNIHDFFVERENVIYLMRPYYSNNKKKFLTLREIIVDYKLAFTFKNYQFKKKNISVKDNSDEEILIALKDLMYLINNNFLIDNDLKKWSDKFFEYFILSKSNHKKDLEYYYNLKLKSYYSWSVIKDNIDWIK